MIAAASAVALLLVIVGVVVYVLRTRRAQQPAPALLYGEAIQGATATDVMPPEVYIGGPYQSPPGAPQPMPGATHPYPVTNLRDGYAPYADPGLGANVFPMEPRTVAGISRPGRGTRRCPIRKGIAPRTFSARRSSPGDVPPEAGNVPHDDPVTT